MQHRLASLSFDPISQSLTREVDIDDIHQVVLALHPECAHFWWQLGPQAGIGSRTDDHLLGGGD